MESTNTNENSFDPTPRLKSSPIPINFVPFNEDDECFYCNESYSFTESFQKYCKNCFLQYVNDITDNNTYLDVLIGTSEAYVCQEHAKIRNGKFIVRNIKEWCNDCSFILCFKQMTNFHYPYYRLIKHITSCTLCGKFVSVDERFKLCSNCYLLSSGWTNSLNEKPIPCLYLPWWDISYQCLVCCNHNLDLISDCQKWCTRCYIAYSGCRYCLTTNIIFGLSDQSQCRKCRRILVISIDIKNITSGNSDIDALLHDSRFNIINDISSIDVTNPLNVYHFIKYNVLESLMEWIPYSRIRNLEELSEGGFGIIYKANWLTRENIVAVKKLKNSQKISKEFLNELKSHYQCRSDYVLRCYGVTKDPNSDEYMLIMQYAKEGSLFDYLQKNFVNINWVGKMKILFYISNGLKDIHYANLIHRDFHSGNILLGVNINQDCRIGDLGLSQPANKTSLNNEIYGVIPYVAPEIFTGITFSKASDVYSLGMIMWECTTGCKPFSDVEHDIELIYNILNGKRPEITKDTPGCFATLITRCWSPDPMKRPDIAEIYEAFRYWYIRNGDEYQFRQAERKRLELIQLKLLGPEFTEKHPKAINTSRSLSSLISKVSSINSTVSLNTKKVEYISREYELDINNVQSSSSTNGSSPLNAQHSGAIYTSKPLSSFISTVNVSRKRKIEGLDNDTQDNEEYIKADDVFMARHKS
ncbi:kinase-like domain-containing protein [Glomus cerebriforme]|uniref:Kinase-like domain-containing protein n=1 Tax=Glomus cerebriforme TaxID=658196 RepID=A0A397S290_9GLOM|nr:kinase-like domain-containing protein [Glomus cerebriforme]